MTKEEKERIQYLMIQYLEKGSTNKEEEQLFRLLNSEQDTDEWVAILEEFIASETEQPNYEPGRWDGVLQKILNDGQRPENNEVTKAKVIGISRRMWTWAAAVASVLLIAAAFWLVKNAENKSLVATNYGQQKKITLPDATEIVLNANSKIEYKEEWKSGKPREIWLSGEALFRVRHLNMDSNLVKQEERFIVHTRHLNIEVLGTVFNVRDRRGKTEIVLEEGKIKVFMRSAAPVIVMVPGQKFSMNAESKKTITNTPNPGDYSAWTKNELILTNTDLREIVEYMEDNFGRRIILSSPDLADRKVEGTFKIDNLDDALLVLSKALNVDITDHGDTLFFTSK